MDHMVGIGDNKDLAVTPFFKFVEVENVPKSERAGRAVMERIEVVEVRIAGNRHVSPVFPTDAMWKRDGNRIITYAERWPDAYRQFKDGLPQEASGTPLEMLLPFGVTPSEVSLLRTLRVYSIEALQQLEGQALKSLGMAQNKLKAAAASFIADRSDKTNILAEMADLKAEIARLKGEKAQVLPENDSTEEEIVEAIDAFEGISDTDIADEIEKITGARPHHKTGRIKLISMLQLAKAA